MNAQSVFHYCNIGEKKNQELQCEAGVKNQRLELVNLPSQFSTVADSVKTNKKKKDFIYSILER